MYFKTTYEDSRWDFLNKAEKVKEKFIDVAIHNYEMPPDNHSYLYTDVLFVPSKKENAKLIVITSGVHGIEGYTGSAIQNMIIDKFILPLEENPDFSYLFIHSINPFGQKYYRRVNTYNVDLNRNFQTQVIKFSPHYEKRNKAYEKFNDFLNPKIKYQREKYEKWKFYWQAYKVIKQQGFHQFKEAVLKGQLQFPKGIFYGGNFYAKQHKMIDALIQQYFHQHSEINIIDIHTGLGKKGKLHLIGMDQYPDMSIYQTLKKYYPKQKIIKAKQNKKKFYKVEGALFEYFYDEGLRMDKKVYPIVWEFGTNNNHRMLKSLDSLRIIRNENQFYHYGATDIKSMETVVKEFQNLFYPKDLKWQRQVLAKAQKTFYRFLKQLSR